jgi:hypothetical protein
MGTGMGMDPGTSSCALSIAVSAFKMYVSSYVHLNGVI